MLPKSLILIALALAVGISGYAQDPPVPPKYVGIVLAPSSFTADIVIEKDSPAPAPATTASLETGAANTGFGVYERGFSPDPASGLPAADSIVASETFPDHRFKLHRSYTAKNAVLLDSANRVQDLFLPDPGVYRALSFLTHSGFGPVTLTCVISFQDGTTEKSSIISPDWFNGGDVALTLGGRADVTSRALDSLSSSNPRLYSVDKTVTNRSSAITNIALAWAGGEGHAVVYAVSGFEGPFWEPIGFKGYNYDMVIEAGADIESHNRTGPTVSLDTGSNLEGYSLYEQGFNKTWPATGLAAPGTTITGVTASDHQYILPPSYTQPNAAVVISHFDATLTPANLRKYTALSFLATAFQGAATVHYSIRFDAGPNQSGTMIVPDWFGGAPVAAIMDGRADVGNAKLDNVNSGNPRLYGIDVLTDRTRFITGVDLTWVSGGNAAFMGLSGATEDVVAPTIDLQPAPTNAYVGGSFSLQANVSFRETFQWQKKVGSAFVNLTDGPRVSGANAPRLRCFNLEFGDAGDYRLIASNPAGSVTSAVAHVNIYSSLTDVTSPTDAIVGIGGTWPDQENPGNLFNNNTTKFLNFGLLSQAAPFVGTISVLVTPALGNSIVTGIRLYAANDNPERDPADYWLGGSIDGGLSFALIASGAVDLGAARNAADLPINPLTQTVSEILFPNTVSYKMYRLIFANARNNATANSVQIGEVELLGVPGPPDARLSIALGANGAAIVSTTAPGALESTTTPGLTPPTWLPEASITTTLPVTTSGKLRIFRLAR